VKNTRPGIIAGLPKIELSLSYVLQIGSGQTFPVLKEGMVELTLGWHPMRTCMFIAKITDKFVLSGCLVSHDAPNDLGCHVL
jgi:hypothetical protein